MSFFKHHVFFCTNQRAPGEMCCNSHGAQAMIVVYPEAVWYTYVDQEDIDEIVESHLAQGKVVERLLID
jgi:(2Fe-2S) ferredoxin